MSQFRRGVIRLRSKCGLVVGQCNDKTLSRHRIKWFAYYCRHHRELVAPEAQPVVIVTYRLHLGNRNTLSSYYGLKQGALVRVMRIELGKFAIERGKN